MEDDLKEDMQYMQQRQMKMLPQEFNTSSVDSFDKNSSLRLISNSNQLSSYKQVFGNSSSDNNISMSVRFLVMQHIAYKKNHRVQVTWQFLDHDIHLINKLLQHVQPSNQEEATIME
eukprot:13250658-Ditylum_brightwellii.AAC.1